MKIDIQKMAQKDVLNLLKGDEGTTEAHEKYINSVGGDIAKYLKQGGALELAQETSKEKTTLVFQIEQGLIFLKCYLTDNPEESSLELEAPRVVIDKVVEHLNDIYNIIFPDKLVNYFEFQRN